ncbi:sensor histidine kinase [Winogradskya consettensis]|uniref:histidine kinase n=1 Tax=Winogradskya consettensis TaxID=113560 RepID=A0A919SKV3_9ACTN|nr:two-component sensor histidine kinase [Actinoplanes consettensis]
MVIPRRDVLIAAAAAVVVSGGTLWAAGVQEPPRPLDGGAFALIAVAAGSLAWRTMPLIALGGALAATAGYVLAGYPFGPVLLCTAWAMAEVSVRRAVRVSGAAVAIAGAVLIMVAAPRFTTHTSVPVFGIVLWGAWWLVVPWALGALARTRRQAAAQAREAGERERRDLIARVALEERVRMSREVHDVAGHGFAVIAMQAGVALVVVDEQPDQVRASLQAIRETSTAALDELRRVLRAQAPEPGLAGLDALARSARSAGLAVELRSIDASGVPEQAGAIAYRVVREALTNVLRHAGAAHATVTVERHAGELSVTVEDDGRGVGGGAGSGIPGIRDLVEEAGGTLTARHSEDGGFVVAACVPVRPE